MKRIFLILLLIICLVPAGCAAISNLSSNILQTNQWYTVSSFIDGDTFKIKTGDHEAKIRLLYVDAPETKTEIEAFGLEAAAYTEKLLTESGEVRLTFDKELTDQYERTLAIVELKDGRILNELLLEQGLAKVLIVEPNIKMENVYKQLEQQAKQVKQGMWSSTENSAHTEFPVKKAAKRGIVTEVDKQAELVTIMNTSSESVALDGWKLVSVHGNQTYQFESYLLEPLKKVVISSGDEAEQSDSTVLQWGELNIWNNKESDPAELYNAYDELVSVWEDE